MKTILIGLASLFILATVLPFVRSEEWWIRIFDFPRAQIAISGVLLTFAYLYFWDPQRVIEYVVFGLLLICVAYQVIQIWPYTPLAPKQVQSADQPVEARDTAPRLSILIANVLMDNRESDRFLELVESSDPDVILTVEVDAWWADRLSVLDDEYEYNVKHPLPNTYGMVLHSRLELVDPVVRHIVDDAIPSIQTRVRLAGGVDVTLHCLHPRPPHPKEDTDTKERDAELLIVARQVKESAEPTIVMGDMNDVAWSRTTSLFQKVSGLLDPRIGRGLYNSFNARNVLLRWPLDHLFHSEHFKLVELRRLPGWGSDHFPIFVHLQYTPTAEFEQETPQPDSDDEEEADEKIEKANDAE